MDILKIWKDKLLYGYARMPGETFPELKDAGFTFRLFRNGTVVYQTYCLDRNRLPVIRRSGRIVLSAGTTGRIEKILAGYAKEIDLLPESTYNGSCDGPINCFVFGGRYVSSLNISRVDARKLLFDNPEYIEEYKENIAQENTVLDIFNRVNEAMRDEGVVLSLNHIVISGERIC